jgi:tRNA A-37 threonylcarbamoyl transferase component Bud32
MNTTPPTSKSPLGAVPRAEVEPPLAEGRYRLVQVLGIGGMATVYRAYDERLQVYRAVKVLSPNLAAHAALRQRFQTEAQTMARLHHAHIVGVHDIGSDGDRVFIVMEMVEGGSAWDYLQTHGPLPPKLAVDICLAVLSALGLAHAKRVVHRDIKPHNVLLARDGTPKVADFGIAHVADTDTGKGLTKTGTVMGTWGFMAPEQRGGAKRVDARADIYSVGATLYALLTDQIPVDLFVAELDNDLLAAIPNVLKPIIQKSTKYRPDDRYDSAAAMAADLSEAHSRLPAVPQGHPPLGYIEPVQDEAQSSMTMVPDSSVAPVGKRGASAPTQADGVFDEGGLKWGASAPTQADGVFDEGGVIRQPALQQGDLQRAVLQRAVSPVDPENAHSPPGFNTESELQGEDPLALIWEPRKPLLPRVLASLVVLLVLGGGYVATVGVPAKTSQIQFGPTVEPAPAAEPPAPLVAPVIIDAVPVAVPEDPDPKNSTTAAPVKTTPSKGKARTGKKATTKRSEPKKIPQTRKATAKTQTEPVPKEPATQETAEDKPPVVETAKPKEQPAATKVEQPVPMAVVFVTGDHSGVWLVATDGRTYKPGEDLKPGSYQVKASFDGGKPVVAGKVRVSAGQRVTLQCDAMFWKCQVQ